MALATAVHVASSIGGIPSVSFRSPTSRSRAASSGFDWYSARVDCWRFSKSRLSFSLGGRDSVSRNKNSIRSFGEGPASEMDRFARERAASTKVGSLRSTRAAFGVLERGRSAVHSSRLGASIAFIMGWRNIRCQ